jgi:uncharacterized membrane protein
MSVAPAPIFEAFIVPHRSLTRKGSLVVVAAMMALTSAVATRSWLLGAWPVAAFSLLEGPLIVLLLVINLRRARASELIMLNLQEFTVIQTDSVGLHKKISLPSAWLRVDLTVDRQSSRVMLRSGGHGCEVGSFLHDPDKLSLFEALRDALHRVRNPRFDNPQLRDAGDTGSDLRRLI